MEPRQLDIKLLETAEIEKQNVKPKQNSSNIAELKTLPKIIKFYSLIVLT